VLITALRLLSLCNTQRTELDLPSLTSPPNARTIGPMGIVFASVAPVNLLLRLALDQPCVDTRTPYPHIRSVSLWPYRSNHSCLRTHLLCRLCRSFRNSFGFRFLPISYQINNINCYFLCVTTHHNHICYLLY